MPEKLMKKVKELEAQYSQISDNLIDATFIIDSKSLLFEYITPKFEKTSGYSPEVFTKFTLKDVLTPISFNDFKKVLAEEKKKYNFGHKKLFQTEVKMIHKDGNDFWIELKAKLLEEPKGYLKIIGIAREISQQKEHEKMQVDLIKELSSALAEKEKLIEENQKLRELLPVCSGCKRIRDDQNKWWPIDMYVAKKTKSDLTHTVCPDCTEVLYGKRYE